MTLSEELNWRGLINQTTFDDLQSIDDHTLTFYFGVDPSSDSMTVGNLAAAMLARHFINHGHRAVLLVGGATGMIGDPDGKKSERELKTQAELDRNVKALSAQYKQVFAGQKFEVVNNYDWFKTMGYLEFLRDIGKVVPMTQLLDRDFVQKRIGEGGSGISYAEFSYSLVQGYDFLHLYRQKGVTVQLCGADQWGNSVAGVDMIRKLDGGEAHVLSTPLVVNQSTGVKFGKSEEGAIWLDDNKTSVYRFYQFWLNLDDHGVIYYLKIYTLLPPEDIRNLEVATQENPEARVAQKTLAYEATKLVHGQAKAEQAKRATDVLFSSGDASELSAGELKLLSAELPLAKSDSLIDNLVETGLAGSKGEARRLMQTGAVSADGQRLHEDAILNTPSLIRRGKNQFALKR